MNLQPRERTKKMLLLWGGVVAVLAVVLYLTLFRSPAEEGPAQTPESSGIVPVVDLSRLESAVLDRFRTWSVLPLTVGETGKENPFAQ
jgi:hypothetical protein